MTAAPRVAYVEIGSPSLHPSRFGSIAEADARLTAHFDASPGPVSHLAPHNRPIYPELRAQVVWTDDMTLFPQFTVTPELRRDAAAEGGILRFGLLQAAIRAASPETYRGARPDLIERYVRSARLVLERVRAALADDDLRRNAGRSWRPPSLLPDPTAAVHRLRERFAARREVRRMGGEWDDEGAAYPATNHADVRYVVNFVSFALGTDLAAFDRDTAALIWNHWSGVRDTVDTLLRDGSDADPYADNEGLWLRQLPALVRLLNDALDAEPRRRNAALTFQSVGYPSEPYPPWLRDLKGQSGVYIIRAPGESGEREIAYVGSSDAGRLYDSLTRHFQSWRRRKSRRYYPNEYTENHDPGLVYPRETAEAAVIITPSDQARDLEYDLIDRLRPRDNLLGQAPPAEEAAPF